MIDLPTRAEATAPSTEWIRAASAVLHAYAKEELMTEAEFRAKLVDDDVLWLNEDHREASLQAASVKGISHAATNEQR
ncbi:hypothetical protein LCGC14_2422880 [marine sediment metagenome]|uniref:Uncharacterized protein n=1 Tax=marine sediment metagenome TaxID=412755 RepID=A0A0F9CBB8_9ZZZZ